MAEFARSHLPSHWNGLSSSSEVEKHVILGDDLKQNIPFCLRNKIVSVCQIQNPYLWNCYQLKKAEYINRYGFVYEKQWYHATAEANVDSIIRNNLDWRRTVRAKFGEGVSFSPCPIYANAYCNRNCGPHRALIVAEVLYHRASDGYWRTEIPKENYDTTCGNKCNVYVKYSDNEFYPRYVIFYTNY